MQTSIHANNDKKLELRMVRFHSATPHEFITLAIRTGDGDIDLFLTPKQVDQLPLLIIEAIEDMRLAHTTYLVDKGA